MDLHSGLKCPKLRVLLEIHYIWATKSERMRFTRTAKDPGSSARTGFFTTAHGEVKTPVFMPVGTVGSVKGVYHRDLKEDIGAEIILGNTYHLYLRPGLDILRKAGGLHKFEAWDRPSLRTAADSGFSLAPIRKITPEGCTFQSHIDGSRHIFTPENNVETRRIIGSDIVMTGQCCPGMPTSGTPSDPASYAKLAGKVLSPFWKRSPLRL